MDALSAILEATKLEGVVYEKLELCGSWGIDVAQDNFSQYWRLIQGSCLLGLPDGQIFEMKEGDLAFIPHGSSHWIASDEKSFRISATEFTKARQTGVPVFSGNGQQTTIIGGHFLFDDKQQLHPFLKDLPQIINVTKFETAYQLMLDHTAQMMHSELNKEQPGASVILRAMAQILFIFIIRSYIEQSQTENNFLSALTDIRISKVLKVIHQSPENDWTMESLAAEAGMSRSVFFNRFKRLVGETPSGYLTNWRIRKAKELLLTGNKNIDEVAANVGYQSEAAFNRIFKSKTGKTPALYRRNLLSSLNDQTE